jgi:hypothetical protein
MRNLLALVGALVVAFAVVGWYRGWYNFKTEPDAAGHQEVNIDINGLKIKQDLNKGRQKLKGVLDAKARDVTAQVPQPAPNEGVPPAAVPSGFAPSNPIPQGEAVVLPSGNAVPPAPAPRAYRN